VDMLENNPHILELNLSSNNITYQGAI